MEERQDQPYAEVERMHLVFWDFNLRKMQVDTRGTRNQNYGMCERDDGRKGELKRNRSDNENTCK